MSRLHQIDPVLNEIAIIMRADPEILKALLEDKERLQAFEKLKASLQKESTDKKIQDDTFFTELDISEILKQDKLFHLFIARKEEVLELLANDAKQLSKNLKEQEEIYRHIEAAAASQKQQLSPELRKTLSLLKEAHEHETQLQSFVSQSNTLQNELHNWEAQQWRPGIQVAAEVAGEAIRARLANHLANDPIHQELRNELAAAPDGEQRLREIDQRQQDVVNIFKEQLGNFQTVEKVRERIQPPVNTTDEDLRKRVNLFSTILFVASQFKHASATQKTYRQYDLHKVNELTNPMREALEFTNNTTGDIFNEFCVKTQDLEDQRKNLQKRIYQFVLETESSKTSLSLVLDQANEHLANCSPEEQNIININPDKTWRKST